MHVCACVMCAGLCSAWVCVCLSVCFAIPFAPSLGSSLDLLGCSSSARIADRYSIYFIISICCCVFAQWYALHMQYTRTHTRNSKVVWSVRVHYSIYIWLCAQWYAYNLHCTCGFDHCACVSRLMIWLAASSHSGAHSICIAHSSAKWFDHCACCVSRVAAAASDHSFHTCQP